MLPTDFCKSLVKSPVTIKSYLQFVTGNNLFTRVLKPNSRSKDFSRFSAKYNSKAKTFSNSQS